MPKLNQFINLANSYYLYRCQVEKCSNCYFTCNLRYLYVQNVVNENESADVLQKLCRLNYSSFYSLWLLLQSLVVIERELVKFHEVLRISNTALTAQNSPEEKKNKEDHYKKDLLIGEKKLS